MGMQETIQRINELAKKAKSESLTEAELAERKVLRQQYIDVFKANFKAELDAIRYVEDIVQSDDVNK